MSRRNLHLALVISRTLISILTIPFQYLYIYYLVTFLKLNVELTLVLKLRICPWKVAKHYTFHVYRAMLLTFTCAPSRFIAHRVMTIHATCVYVLNGVSYRWFLSRGWSGYALPLMVVSSSWLQNRRARRPKCHHIRLPSRCFYPKILFPCIGFPSISRFFPVTTKFYFSYLESAVFSFYQSNSWSKIVS
jgi:hypothetical protein